MENMVMNKNFWSGKKVFITGHTGFKGSWTSLWLQNLGANITGFSLENNSQSDFYNCAKVSLGMNSIIGDIRDYELLKKSIQSFNPDIVIHMAAQALVRESYKNPIETYSTNIMGTVNILEVCREVKTVKAVINVTSDKCYKNEEREEGYKENEPMGGYDPYSSSKGCAELVSSAYNDSFFFQNNDKALLASVRAGNVIGGGDWSKDRLIPDIIRSFYKNNPVLVRNPNSVRPWQFVLEPIRGYLLLAEKLFQGNKNLSGAWNFGPRDNDVMTVEWIAKKMCEEWGDLASWCIETKRDNILHEAKYLKLDISKAKDILHWNPVLNIEETISFIVEWYKNFENEKDMKKISINQINEYQDKVDHVEY